MQIFSNIIGNALKYSKEGVPPLIKIRSQNKEDYTLISIADNGLGIKEENLAPIFEKKGRVNEGEEAPKGYGIGLYNVKKMVKENEGDIWVESTFGKGSTFFLKFKKDLF